MSKTYRATFHETGSLDKIETIIVKFARNDKSTREAVFYRRFYDKLSVGLPKCYSAIVDPEAYFTIVLEDLGNYDGYQGAQLEGCDYEHAALALKTLAQLQAPVVGNTRYDEDEWLNPAPALDQKFYNECLPTFRIRQTLTPEQEKLLDQLSTSLDVWWETREPHFCIFHGDYRLDNTIYLAKDNKCAVAVDWGSLSWASPLRDVAYLLGNGLITENRRKWEEDLVRDYLDELNRLSTVKMTWDQAWKQYRLQSIHGLAQQ